MRTLIPCRACGRHVFSDEASCPFCKGIVRRVTAPTLVVGGALLVAAAACSSNVTGGGGNGGNGGHESTITSSSQGGGNHSTTSSTTCNVNLCQCGMGCPAYAPPNRSDWA